MNYLTVAMAKGRTADRALTFLNKAGVHFSEFHDASRKLVIFDDDNKVK